MKPYITMGGGIHLAERFGWGILITPTNQPSPRLWKKVRFYAIDNGAWSHHKNRGYEGIFSRHRSLDLETRLNLFEDLLRERGRGAEFAVLPDIVEGGMESLHFSLSWLAENRYPGISFYLPVQDGMTPNEVEEEIAGTGEGRIAGIFLGGSTEWKERTMGSWGEFIERWRMGYHVARVNTARRMRKARLCGATSIDGNSINMFPSTIHLLEGERSQQVLDLGGPGE